MQYLLTVVIVAIFVVVYVVLYKLNSKIEIDCEKDGCVGCNFIECIHRHEKEEK